MKPLYLFTTGIIIMSCFLAMSQNKQDSTNVSLVPSKEHFYPIDPDKELNGNFNDKNTHMQQVVNYLSQAHTTAANEIPCYPVYQHEKRYMWQHVPPTTNASLDLRSQPYIPYQGEKTGVFWNTGIFGNYTNTRECPNFKAIVAAKTLNQSTNRVNS